MVHVDLVSLLTSYETLCAELPPRPSAHTLRKLIKHPELYKCPDSLRTRDHSHKLDQILGLRINQIEKKLYKSYGMYDGSEKGSLGQRPYQETQTWIGLHPQV